MRHGEPWKECPNETHHRADREIDPSTGNNERCPDADEREEGGAT